MCCCFKIQIEKIKKIDKITNAAADIWSNLNMVNGKIN